MITNEESQDWQRDIGEAQQTHPNAFANGPFVKSLFRTAQQLSIVEQRLVSLAKAVRDSGDSLQKFVSIAERAVESSDKLGRRLFWLNVVLASATVVGAIATVIIAIR